MKEETVCDKNDDKRKGEVSMKRMLSFTLGAAMVLSLAACGGKGGNPASETKAQGPGQILQELFQRIPGWKQKSHPQIRSQSVWLTTWQNPIRPIRHL